MQCVWGGNVNYVNYFWTLCSKLDTIVAVATYEVSVTGGWRCSNVSLDINIRHVNEKGVLSL